MKLGSRTEISLVVGFGVLNAVLYASLLPLWEGFDEPFHYGYVQTLDSRGRFPVLGETVLSEEVLESMRLAPASPVVKQNVPFAITFSEYFAMPAADRSALRARLWTLPAQLRWKDSGATNYEGQQAPLAYALLAPADLLWSQTPLPRRVLRLRLVTSIFATLLTALLGLALARAIGLDERWHASVVLLIFCAQMFYAAVARISNDWLAVPAMTAMFLAVVRFAQKPDIRRGIWMGASVAIGLLIKAYFLFAVPFALVAAIAAGRKALRPMLAVSAIVAIAAGPWYARNLSLYGNLSGVMQARGGVHWLQTLHAAARISWLGAIGGIIRSAIWTGNNSFTSFSNRTVTAVMILLACAFLAWVRLPRERLVAMGCALFGCALLFGQALMFEGEVTASPWYTIAAAGPVACLLAAGLSRAGRIGQWIAAALHGVLAYMIVATYWLKLIPMYAGFPQSRGRVWEWYRSGGWAGLEETALAPPRFLMALAALVAAAAIGLFLLRSRQMMGFRGKPRRSPRGSGS